MKSDSLMSSEVYLTELLRTLEIGGFSANLVGGCVRDTLLGRTVNDIDVSTNATPKEVHDLLFYRPEFTLYPTGVEHGTWTVGTPDGSTYEVTSYRRDVATDGRRAVVAFSRDVADDAFRRDFTMNALYMDRKGHVLDPTGEGLSDLKARRVRFVGDAIDRCREDYLRILRLFRFHATVGNGPMDEDALRAVTQTAGGLRTVSGERVWSELKKILGAPDPSNVLLEMHKTGVLTSLLRGYKLDIDAVKGVVHAEQSGGYVPKWERRYYALMGQFNGVPFPAANSEKRYQERLRAAVGMNLDVRSTAFLFKDAALACDTHVIHVAQNAADLCSDVTAHASEGVALVLPVSSQDLVARGVEPGPEMGKLLKKARDLYMETGFVLKKEAILDCLL